MAFELFSIQPNYSGFRKNRAEQLSHWKWFIRKKSNVFVINSICDSEECHINENKQFAAGGVSTASTTYWVIAEVQNSIKEIQHKSLPLALIVLFVSKYGLHYMDAMEANNVQLYKMYGQSIGGVRARGFSKTGRTGTDFCNPEFQTCH